MTSRLGPHCWHTGNGGYVFQAFRKFSDLRATTSKANHLRQLSSPSHPATFPSESTAKICQARNYKGHYSCDSYADSYDSHHTCHLVSVLFKVYAKVREDRMGKNMKQRGCLLYEPGSIEAEGRLWESVLFKLTAVSAITSGFSVNRLSLYFTTTFASLWFL